MTRFFIVVFALIPPASVYGQSGPPATIPILREAALPIYPPIARAAHVSGKVTVRLAITNGLVGKTDFVSKINYGGRGWLEDAAVTNIGTWRFDRNVNTTLTVTYTYKLVGPETDDVTNPTVQMFPSLDVRISARSVKPHVDY